jgi:hypothetical protein
MNSDPNVQYDMNAMQYEMSTSPSPTASQCAATVARNCETPLIHHVGAAATDTDYCDKRCKDGQYLNDRPSAYDHNSHLADIVHCEDLWENVCSWLTGDALTCLANVNTFSLATRITPAFMLLAGLNDDAELVPWSHPTNVLSGNHVPTLCALCDCYDCKHNIGNLDRDLLASTAAETMLSAVQYPVYLKEKPCHMECPVDLRYKQIDHPRPYIRSGPARPPSPFDCSDAAYDPITPAGCARSLYMNPPVFGVRPGFSYAPFWSVLVHWDEMSDGSNDSDHCDY